MSLNQHAHVLWRHKWLMLLLVAAALGTAVAVTVMTQKYVAGATLHVATRLAVGSDSIRPDDLAYIDRLENTYSNLAESPAFTERLQGEIGASHTPQITVSGIPSSELMNVRAEAGSRTAAAATANAAAELLIERVASLSARPSPAESDLTTEIERISEELTAKRAAYVALAASSGVPPGAEARAELRQADQEIEVLQTRLSELQSELDSMRASRQERGRSLTLLEPALPSTTKSESHLGRNLAIAGIIGLLVAIGLAYLAERIRPVIHGETELRATTGAPILGSIPTVRRRLVSSTFNGGSPAEDAFRRLRLALLALNADGGAESWRSFLITSPEHGDGKTTVTANLGQALASSGRNVLIIDGDMRNPMLGERFEVSNGLGFADLLKGLRASRLIKETKTPGLFVLPSGIAKPSSPGSLLERADLATLLEDVIAEYDYVLLDSPPVLDASDALLYASATDATILVIRQAAVPRDVVAQAVAELEAVNVRFVGLVVNRAARSRDYVRTP